MQKKPREVPSISALEAEILERLRAKPSYGLQLVSDSIRRGSVYVTLGKLASKRWVSGRTEDGGLKRYALTERGRAVLDAWQRLQWALAGEQQGTEYATEEG